MRKIIIPKDTLINRIQIECKTFKDVADEFNTIPSVVSRLCKSYGISKPHGWKYGKSFITNHTEITSDWLMEHWVNTSLSLHELSEKFNVSESLLEFRTKKFGLTKKYKHRFNTEKLYDLSDPHVFYLAGLVATDGYLNKGKNSIEIDLTGDSEKDLLVDIKDYYEMSAEVVTYNKSNRLRFAEESLTEFFRENFNISDGAKTFSVGTIPNFTSENLAKAYVLGCFDGDGSISWSTQQNRHHLTHYLNVQLCTASYDFVYGLKQIIDKYTDLNISFTTVGDKYYRISASYRKAQKLLGWMYSVDNCFSLRRKRDIYLSHKVDDIV